MYLKGDQKGISLAVIRIVDYFYLYLLANKIIINIQHSKFVNKYDITYEISTLFYITPVLYLLQFIQYFVARTDRLNIS
jgi:hypothetical protein